jgi:hypothetical protein
MTACYKQGIILNKMKKLIIIQIALIVLSLAGEIQCVYKAVKCNWNPIGKAEVIYTVSACTGLGAIVGWFNIKDN